MPAQPTYQQRPWKMIFELTVTYIPRGDFQEAKCSQHPNTLSPPLFSQLPNFSYLYLYERIISPY